MNAHRCPYCLDKFVPSRYRPDQLVCSRPNCQRQRRAAYHRQKLQDDPSYRDQCRDSQQQWREQHPEYMRAYREEHKACKTQPSPGVQPDLVRLLEYVKNNVAIDLKSCPATVVLIGSDDVKNNVATAQLILVQELPDKH